MPALFGLLSRLLPSLPASTLIAGLDASLLLVTLPMVYLLSIRSIDESSLSGPDRSLRIVLALLFAVAALPWLAQYARTETMPTAFFLLASALCIRKRAAWCVALQIGLTLVQAFTRSDVPLCLGLAMLLVALISKPRSGTQRRLGIAWGLAILLASGLVQGYLQFIRFPHLTYAPGVRVWQGLENLLPHRWINGGLAVGPVCLSIIYGLRKKRPDLLDTADRVCVLAALLYLPLWFCVGSLAEPRIFLPFLLVLSPLAGRSVALSLSPAETPPLSADRR